jgi:RNA 2',3'-cyclic 3'-phosphodiesterase
MASYDKLNPEKTIRSFISIGLPTHTKKWLSEIQGQLKKTGIQASWSKPPTWHLTLVFLDQIQVDRLKQVKAIMETAAKQIPAFFLYAAGAGVFPSVKQARVVWIGINGQTSVLTNLVTTLNQALSDQIGVKKETRQYCPHLTLARLKQPGPGRCSKEIVSFMQKIENKCSQKIEVVSFDLIKSELTSSGARHELIYSAALKK